MRFLLVLILCLDWTASQAQSLQSKLELHSIYMPQFTVQEASDRNVQAIGLRWMLSDYDRLPLEFGFQAYTGYGEVARASVGLNLAYLLAKRKSHQFKLGLGLSRIDLEDVEVNEEEFGSHVGDVSFTSWGTEFKPYLEWEWAFSSFSSLFVQTGYRVINGEKSVVTSVTNTNDPDLNYNIADEWDESFFYSGSGFEFGLGLSVNLY